MEAETLVTRLVLIDDRVKYAGAARDYPEITIDYRPPFGTGQGYNSLELLLLSFTSCVSTTALSLLRSKMGRTITAAEVTASGTLAEKHPKKLTRIEFNLTITSPDVTETELRQAIQVSEEKLCPVWAMIKGNTEVSPNFTIRTS